MNGDDFQLIYQPVPPDGSDEVFALALEDVVATSAVVAIASPYLSFDVLWPIVEGRGFRLVTDQDACFEAGCDPVFADFLVRNIDHVRTLRGLHAKVVLGDRAGLFGSANLTTTALCRRFEMASVVRGRGLSELRAWFEALWAQSTHLDLSSLVKRSHEPPATALIRRQAVTGMKMTGSLGWLARSRGPCAMSDAVDGDKTMGRPSRVPEPESEAAVVRPAHGSAWWFGVNNGSTGHRTLDDMAPLFAGNSLRWPFGRSKTVPRGAYQEMVPGDQLLLWTGRGRERGWGIIGTATIERVHDDHLVLNQGVRFDRPLTPFPRFQPAETETVQFLLQVFGESFKPLGDVRQAVFGEGRTNPITVAKVTRPQLDRVLAHVQERSVE